MTTTEIIHAIEYYERYDWSNESAEEKGRISVRIHHLKKILNEKVDYEIDSRNNTLGKF